MSSTQTYRVQSVNTKYYPVTDGAAEGAIVNTENGASSVPPDSVLTFSEAVDDKPVIVTISVSIPGGPTLYIALPDNATDDTKLIWTTTPYQWTVNPTIAADHTITYQFSPANGQDFYIYDSFSIGPYLVVEPGASIVPPQSFFSLTPAQ